MKIPKYIAYQYIRILQETEIAFNEHHFCYGLAEQPWFNMKLVVKLVNKLF